jgi:ABC-type multidrug transport system fused ATPase/permease subunit
MTKNTNKADFQETIFTLVLYKIMFISIVPFVIFFIFGISNFGSDFFSTTVWTESLERRINPIFSGAAVVLFFCAVIFNIFDAWKSRPSYVGILENNITIRGRKVAKIESIDISNVKKRGVFGNIIEIPLKDGIKNIHISLIYTNLNYQEAIDLLREKIQLRIQVK